MSIYYSDYNTAEFINVGALRPRLPRWSTSKIGLPKLPQYQDRIGRNLQQMRNLSIMTGKLPTNQRIVKSLIPALTQDALTNPIKTIQNNLPRLRRGRAAIRLTTGIRVPGRKGIKRGIGNYAKSSLINAGSTVGATVANTLVPGSGVIGGLGGSVLGSMTTRKAGGAIGDLYNAYKKPGNTFQNFRNIRKNRSIPFNANTYGDITSNAIGSLTPIGSLPFGADIAGKLTPNFQNIRRNTLQRFNPNKVQQKFNNLKTSFNRVKNIRSNLNERLSKRYRNI